MGLPAFHTTRLLLIFLSCIFTIFIGISLMFFYQALTSLTNGNDDQGLSFLCGLLILSIIVIFVLIDRLYVSHSQAKDSKIALKNLQHNQQQLEEKFHQHLYHDNASQLPNQKGVANYMTDHFSITHDMSLTYVSIDNHQDLLDIYGDQFTHTLFKHLTTRLNALLPSQGILGKINRHTFCYCCAGMSQLDAEIQANRIFSTLKENIHLEGVEVHLEYSIGIACSDQEHPHQQDLLRHADIALNKAKKRQERIVTYNIDMQRQLIEKKQQEQAVKTAIHQKDIALVYQAQVDIRTHAVVGIESLIRWNGDPQFQIAPDQLIQTAEDIGMMQKLGQWIIETALRDYSTMLDERCAPKHIAINISGKEFQDPRLAEFIIRAIEHYDIPPSRVHIELTEQIFIENIEKNHQILNRLANSGISLAIDDFGTGYSSLAYLKNFPINTVKIDRSFIKDLPQSKDDLIICQAVISMANLLDLNVVAEGIETLAQQEILRKIGCYVAQGFYYHKPVGAAQIIQLMKNQRSQGNHYSSIQSSA